MARVPRTQKAAGIVTLKTVADWKVPTFALVQSESDAERAFLQLQSYGAVFGRPCPPRPRHGFLDSRELTSASEAALLLRDTLQLEPDGEAILMTKIDATYNVVWRPGLVAIGVGHDGATSGNDSITFPVNTKYPMSIDQLKDSARVKADEAPYIEAVISPAAATSDEMLANEHNKAKSKKAMFGPIYTQLRGGPMVEGCVSDYIPSDMTVKRVVPASGDLLEWEKTAAKLKVGDVVYHAGGNLGSHYAVHCILHKIPYVTTFEPTVGQRVKAAKVAPLDPEALMDGVVCAWSVPFNRNRDDRDMVMAVLTGLHNAAAMMNGFSSWFIGAAAGIMMRLGAAAALGESRHAKRFTEYHVMSAKTVGAIPEGSRHQIFQRAFTASNPFKVRAMLPEAYRKFVVLPWQGAVGGKKWAECTKSVELLDDAVLRLAKDLTEQNANAVVSALNFCVNQAHNNGWWLNKFAADTNDLDAAAENHPHVAIAAARIFHYIMSTFTQRDQDKMWELWKTAEPLNFSEALKGTLK